jgi:putative acetyltransferase
MDEPVIAIDDPRAPDVRVLVERHLAFAHETTPIEDVHALRVEALVDSAVTFFSARLDDHVRGVGALKHLDDEHAEVKSMHTAAEARGRGIARAVLAHIVAVARQRGYRRLSLETGAGPAFAAARNLYVSAGFRPCAPFSDYRENSNSAYLTLALADDIAV